MLIERSELVGVEKVGGLEAAERGGLGKLSLLDPASSVLASLDLFPPALVASAHSFLALTSPGHASLDPASPRSSLSCSSLCSPSWSNLSCRLRIVFELEPATSS
jgi:hypothetical protein